MPVMRPWRNAQYPSPGPSAGSPRDAPDFMPPAGVFSER